MNDLERLGYILRRAAALGDSDAEDMLSKECVSDSSKGMQFVRLDFPDRRDGYFMLVADDAAIQISYHPPEQDGKIVLSKRWSHRAWQKKRRK
jgi:hypothetical protein